MSINPAEWDFRSVPAVSIPRVLTYERMRSHPSAKAKILAIINHQVDDWTKADKKISCREGLQRRIVPRSFYDQVEEDFLGVVDPYFIEHFFGRFPAPFLEIFPKGIAPTGSKAKPFRVYPIDQRPHGARVFVVDRDAKLGEILKAFAEWAKDEKIKGGQGKKIRDRFAALKMLAAYRFKEKKIRYSDAKKIIEKRRVNCAISSYGDVLPNYKSVSAWDRAVEQAELAITEEFKNMSIPFAAI